MNKIDQDDKDQENDLEIPNEQIIGEMTTILGKGDTDKFVKYCQDLLSGDIEKCTILDFDSDFCEKEKRTQVHQFFKRCLKKYETDTLSVGERRTIRVFLKTGVSKNKR